MKTEPNRALEGMRKKTAALRVCGLAGAISVFAIITLDSTVSRCTGDPEAEMVVSTFWSWRVFEQAGDYHSLIELQSSLHQWGNALWACLFLLTILFFYKGIRNKIEPTKIR
jgi:hypothetical protein